MWQIIDRLFPRMCVFCGLTESASGICTGCEHVLPHNDNYCVVCGQPIDALDASSAPCGACISKLPTFDIARAPMRYEFPIDVAIKKLKFNHRLVFAPPLASLLMPVIEQTFSTCDVLVPVPLYRWRHARRGFNQADELCKTVSSMTGLPVFLGTVRRRATRSQSGLDAAARSRNVSRAFVINERLTYSYPLIIDDVMTTGATCNELATVLKRAGADRVGVLSVARSSGL